MTITVTVNDTRIIQDIYAHADQCPICHHKITPRTLWVKKRSLIDGADLEIVYECPNQRCDELFIGYFARSGTQGPIRLYDTRPFRPASVTLPQPIQDISSAFCVIYDEAHRAEKFGLTQICGVGYRKAIEFLVKDYLIKEQREVRASIEDAALGQCIENYVTDPKIKEVAKRATWLGNDETHYKRLWIDKDLHDLKTLIRLVLHWIEAEHLTEEALASMPAKK